MILLAAGSLEPSAEKRLVHKELRGIPCRLSASGALTPSCPSAFAPAALGMRLSGKSKHSCEFLKVIFKRKPRVPNKSWASLFQNLACDISNVDYVVRVIVVRVQAT